MLIIILANIHQFYVLYIYLSHLSYQLYGVEIIVIPVLQMKNEGLQSLIYLHKFTQLVRYGDCIYMTILIMTVIAN